MFKVNNKSHLLLVFLFLSSKQILAGLVLTGLSFKGQDHFIRAIIEYYCILQRNY